MMHQATRAIVDALSRTSYKYETDEIDNKSLVSLRFRGDNGCQYTIRFISADEDNDVSIRVYKLLSLQGDQRVRILPSLNFLNNKYRFVKFVCDKDGDVNVEYDYPVRSINPAASAEEMVRRFANIIEESYPVLMKAVWGNN